MLSKKFYDILVLVFVILFIGLTYYSDVLVKDAVRDAMDSRSEGSTESIVDIASKDSRIGFSENVSLGARILAGIYWIFMVVLVIGLHKLGKNSLLDVILVVVLAPLAIVFYFLTLRPRLKEVGISPQTKIETGN